jgi:hypothetical protein
LAVHALHAVVFGQSTECLLDHVFCFFQREDWYI